MPLPGAWPTRAPPYPDVSPLRRTGFSHAGGRSILGGPLLAASPPLPIFVHGRADHDRDPVPAAGASLILTCPECTTRYRFEESRIPQGGLAVRCKRCRAVFTAHRPGM